MKKPAPSFGPYQPSARPMKPPITAPAMPSSIVTMNPPGSRPGISSLAIAPTIKPKTIQPMHTEHSVTSAVGVQIEACRKRWRRLQAVHGQRIARTSRYFSAPPVLNSTTDSSRLDRAVGDEPLDRRQRGAAFGRGADAFVLADLQHAVDHRLVGDGDRGAAALAHRAQNQEVADRARHAQAVGDRRRALPRLAPSRSPCSNARTIGAQPSACTDTIRGRCAGVDPADALDLLERLPHADHAGAAAGRIDDPVGPLPVHLLGELVGHRLLAFDAVRLLQRRHVVPAERPAVFGGDAAGVGDQAVDQRDVGAVQPALVDERPLGVPRDEDLAREPGARRRRRRRRCRRCRPVGSAIVVAPRYLRARDRRRLAARLERVGRVERFVLDVEAIEAERRAERAARGTAA